MDKISLFQVIQVLEFLHFKIKRWVIQDTWFKKKENKVVIIWLGLTPINTSIVIMISCNSSIIHTQLIMVKDPARESKTRWINMVMEVLEARWIISRLKN